MNPTLNLRLCYICSVISTNSAKTPSTSDTSTPTGTLDTDIYGKLEIVWLDGYGKNKGYVDYILPAYSWQTGSGFFYVPQKGDVVACLMRPGSQTPIVVGSFPYLKSLSIAKAYTQKDILDALNTNSSMAGYLRPLVSGEYLLKSAYQGEIVLNKAGSVQLLGRNTDNTETYFCPVDSSGPVILGEIPDEAKLSRVKYLDNTDADLTIGTTLVKETVNPLGKIVVETINDNTVKSRQRVITNVSETTTITHKDTIEKISDTLKDINNVTSITGQYNSSSGVVNVTFIKGVDFVLDLDSEGYTTLNWLNTSSSKNPIKNTSCTVTYNREKELCSIRIDDKGNYILQPTSALINIPIDDTSSYPIKFDNSGNLYLGYSDDSHKLTSLSAYIKDIVTLEVNKALVNIADTLDVNTKTLNITSINDTTISSDSIQMTPTKKVSIGNSGIALLTESLIALFNLHTHITTAPGVSTGPAIPQIIDKTPYVTQKLVSE